MRYKLLGGSGLRVSELALGTMAFGEDWGWGASKEESRKILDAFAEAGGNFVDTADAYTDGTAERYVSISDTPAWIIARGNVIAEQHGWTPFSAVQAQYSLVERTAERDLAPMTQALDLALCAWSPLGSGVLTGKYQGDAAAGDARLHSPNVEGAGILTERNLGIARVVGEVAAELGATSAQVALAWLRSRPGVVLPILGARRESQLRDNLGVLAIDLADEQRTRLDEASAVDLGFPHEFIAGVRGTPFVLGDAADRIDDHRAERSGLGRRAAR